MNLAEFTELLNKNLLIKGIDELFNFISIEGLNDISPLIRGLYEKKKIYNKIAYTLLQNPLLSK
jgi:hypothetical protein